MAKARTVWAWARASSGAFTAVSRRASFRSAAASASVTAPGKARSRRAIVWRAAAGSPPSEKAVSARVRRARRVASFSASRTASSRSCPPTFSPSKSSSSRRCAVSRSAAAGRGRPGSRVGRRTPPALASGAGRGASGRVGRVCRRGALGGGAPSTRRSLETAPISSSLRARQKNLRSSTTKPSRSAPGVTYCLRPPKTVPSWQAATVRPSACAPKRIVAAPMRRPSTQRESSPRSWRMA